MRHVILYLFWKIQLLCRLLNKGWMGTGPNYIFLSFLSYSFCKKSIVKLYNFWLSPIAAQRMFCKFQPTIKVHCLTLTGYSQLSFLFWMSANIYNMYCTASSFCFKPHELDENVMQLHILQVHKNGKEKLPSSNKECMLLVPGLKLIFLIQDVGMENSGFETVLSVEFGACVPIVVSIRTWQLWGG